MWSRPAVPGGAPGDTADGADMMKIRIKHIDGEGGGSPNAAAFADFFSSNYQFYFPAAYRAMMTGDVKAPSGLLPAADGAGGAPDFSPSYFSLFAAASAPMTQKAVQYIKEHSAELAAGYGFPADGARALLRSVTSYPAMNLKNCSVTLSSEEGMLIADYSGIDSPKISKKNFTYTAAVPAVHIDLKKTFYKKGLSDCEIETIIGDIFTGVKSAPARKLHFPGRPDNLGKLVSQLRKTKKKCLAAESPAFLWFENEEGLFEESGGISAYIGAVDDYVGFLFDRANCERLDLRGGRPGNSWAVAPFLTNPGAAGTVEPPSAPVAGIDIGMRSVFTAAVWTPEGITDLHVGRLNMKECADLAQDRGLRVSYAKKSVCELLKAFSKYGVKQAAVEDVMIAKVQKNAAPARPVFAPDGRIKTRTRPSLSEEEEFYTEVTSCLLNGLSSAGIKILAVGTYKTSKVCSNCGEPTKPANPNSRSFSCPYCGAALDRDENAARNILNKLYNDGGKHLRKLRLPEQFKTITVYRAGPAGGQPEMIEKFGY